MVRRASGSATDAYGSRVVRHAADPPPAAAHRGYWENAVRYQRAWRWPASVDRVDTPPSSHLDLEVLAAELRRHSADLSLYAGFLLNVLSAALPGELIQVRREGKWSARLAGREPAVVGVSV